MRADKAFLESVMTEVRKKGGLRGAQDAFQGSVRSACAKEAVKEEAALRRMGGELFSSWTNKRGNVTIKADEQTGSNGQISELQSGKRGKNMRAFRSARFPVSLITAVISWRDARRKSKDAVTAELPFPNSAARSMIKRKPNIVGIAVPEINSFPGRPGGKAEDRLIKIIIP